MNIQSSHLAKKYAIAFTHTTALAATDYKNLQELLPRYTTSKELLLLLHNVLLQEATQNGIFEHILSVLQVPPLMHTLMRLLIDHHRIILLPAVIKHIIYEYQRQHAIIECLVEHSHTLNEHQRAVIEQFLYKKTGKNIECSYRLNASLIAGVRLTSATFTWEHSIQQQLCAITKTLDH